MPCSTRYSAIRDLSEPPTCLQKGLHAGRLRHLRMLCRPRYCQSGCDVQPSATARICVDYRWRFAVWSLISNRVLEREKTRPASRWKVGADLVLGGGKFANGAETGAFGYLFNYLMHGRDFTRQEGQKIADDAATWKGTPYVTGGQSRAGADCSWSTYCIFDESGFPYGYRKAGQFIDAAANNPNFPFRLLGPNEQHQAGDVIVFDHPDHVAIYAGDGWMWTATHPGGAPYLEQQMKYWPKPIGWVRPQAPAGGH